ncbi:hypothetical protein [Solirubrobacter soli]|uniref:hypothetical protein n=1 Tax=Solirubrobacter soli TaxID=363832 RepID=UPI0004239A82|nr:hypothetical protein [Solirubrobacter soli]
MEVVVLLVAIVGVALIAIPRLQRRRAGARRIKRVSSPIVAAAAVPASSAAAWAPPASSDEDVWEDDLGWEGVSSPSSSSEAAPGAREAWEEWRSSALSGMDAAAASSSEPDVRELPSVERWREREDEWVDEDDDGLGWEGERAPSAEPAGFVDGDSSASDDWSFGGHDWSRGNPPSVGADSAPAFASASAAAAAAAAAAGEVTAVSDSDPELGRATAPVDDSEEWGSPITRTWGAAPSGRSAAASATPGLSKAAPRPGGRRVHPVLLVALYAAIGIGLVVLVSTVLLGGSSSSETPSKPAATPQPVRSTATPAPTVAATVAATATATPTPDPAIAAAARSDFLRERATADRRHKAALTAAVAAEKRAIKKAKARAAARKREQAASRTTTPGPTATYTPPAANTYTPPSSSGSSQSKPRPACEFCIG